MAGFLSSLADALPYAIPAIAGAIAGGPAVGMIGGAGGAEAASQNMNQQIALANAIGSNRYRQQELALRQQQIEAAKQEKEAELESTQAYRKGMLGEKQSEFGQRMQQHQDDQDFLRGYRQNQQALMQQGMDLRAQIAAAHTQEQKDALEERHLQNVRARIAGAESLADRAGEEAVKHESMWSKVNPFALSNDDVKERSRKTALIKALKDQGLTADELRNAGVEPDVIKAIYPPPKATPKPEAPKQTPSEKLRMAGAKSKPLGKTKKAPGIWTKDGKRYRVERDGSYYAMD